MADRQETVTITTKSDLPDAFKQAEQGAKDLGGSIKDVGDASKQGATATEGFTDKLNKAKVAFAALKAAVLDTVKAFAEQDALVGQLSTSYDRFVGGTAQDVERGLDKITENSIKYGVAVNDQITALKNLAQASGDALTAEQDLALAIDIAADGTTDLKGATDILVKARLGDVGALKKLGVFSKDFLKDLTKITDETERATIAQAAIAEKFTGTAEANKGLADDINATEGAGKALAVAVGSVATELGGFIASMIELLPFMEEGELSIGNVVRAFTNFAEALKNTSAGIAEFKAGLDNLDLTELLWSSDDAADLITNIRVQGRRAGHAAAEAVKEGAEEGPKVTVDTFFGPELDAETRLRLAKEAEERRKAEEKAAAEEAKRKEAARKAAEARRKAEAAEVLRAEAEQLKGIADARKKFEDDQKTQAARDFRDRQARLVMEGEERLALQERLENSGATEGETELALSNFDATREKLEREAEVRERIAQLKRDGLELEAEALRITNSNLTATEKANALDALNAKASKEKAAAALEAAGAAKASVTGVLALAGEEEAAKRAGAALDALVYQYQAIGAFASGNIPAGVQFQVAAVSAFAVAASSGGGGGGAAKAPAGGGSSAPAGTAERSAATDAQRTAAGAESSSSVTYVLNLRSLSKPTRQEAREFLDATERERRTRIGG